VAAFNRICTAVLHYAYDTPLQILHAFPWRSALAIGFWHFWTIGCVPLAVLAYPWSDRYTLDNNRRMDVGRLFYLHIVQFSSPDFPAPSRASPFTYAL
jgi:hypothetical protein